MFRLPRTFAFAAMLIAASSAHAQPQANGRELGFAVSVAQDGDLPGAVAKAQAACMATIHISISWNNLHPDTLSWNANVLTHLDLINLYFASIGVKVELQIGPVNTVVDQSPAELVGLPYNDPRVVRDMQRTLDTVFAHFSGVQLAALNISNESDVLWGTDAALYSQFGQFMQEVAPHAKAAYFASHGDTLSVGTTFTWAGLTDPLRAPLCQIANAASDHISATYYGIQNDFTVKPPTDVIADMDLLMAMQPNPQPVRLAEIGYPTSSTCVSSDELQVQFVQAAFTAWDQHAYRMKYMGWFLLTDWDSATVDTLGAYYGISSPVFLEYLRTLGLRTNPGSGTDKPAYQTLLCELQARSFCATACANGIPEQTLRDPVIAPNPAKDIIRITGATVVDGTPINFVSMAGLTQFTLPFAAEIDISMIPPGVYAVRIPGLAPALLVIAGR